MKRHSRPTSGPSISPIADQPLLLRLHRWLGLAIALVVGCVGFTGALTTYQQEIDAWLNADLLRVEPAAGPPQSLDRVVAAVAAALGPEIEILAVRLPRSRDDSVEVSVAPPAAGALTGWYVYVDPHDARVLGSRPFDPVPWTRRGVVASLYEIHYSLAASRTGVWTVTVAAALWIAAALLGAWLAWPGSPRGWRRVLQVRCSGNATRVARDLHRSTGLLTVMVVVPVLATGIVLNQSPLAAAIVQRVSSLSSEPDFPARSRSPTMVATGWQAAVDAAGRNQTTGMPSAIRRDAGRGLFIVRVREPDAIHRRGQTHVYVDERDAAVLAVRSPRSGSVGDRFLGWQNPLHSGHAFGAAGRAVVFLSGLAALLLVLTGVPLWYTRRRQRSRR